MKILALRFKNLNSLYGEWAIDFSTPEFVSNGIFAITGPTGAGKSTLLDAICLALYGATPRLGKITKNSNQLMSAQTAECFAEVTFESQQGRFICHWSQHRARKKTDGTLGESKHEIIDAVTGTILESKKRDVALVIEEKTGMDFERFTRSILLAQGGFSAFLMASADERAPILEQITGTEIYSEISKRVHEKNREERETLHLIQAELAGITLLSDEQEKSYITEYGEKKSQEEDLIRNAERVSQSLQWVTTIETLNEELGLLTIDHSHLHQELTSFENDRNRLLQANQSMELDGDYATLKSMRTQQHYDKEALAKEMLNTPKLQSSLESKNKLLIEREQALQHIKAEQNLSVVVTKNVRHIDQQLLDKGEKVKQLQLEIEGISKDVAIKIKELRNKKTFNDALQQELLLADDYLQKNAHDEALLSQLTGIEEQLKSLILIQSKRSEKNDLLAILDKRRHNSSEALEKHGKQEATYQTRLTNITEQIKPLNVTLTTLLGDSLLREYRREKDHLLREMAFHQKIQNLEMERQQLKEGKPCPLCGSNAHPYAENTIPKATITEEKINFLAQLIEQAEGLEQQIATFKASEEELRKKIADVMQLKSMVLHEKNQAEKDWQACLEKINQLSMDCEQLEHSTLERLIPFGIQQVSNFEEILSTLKVRLEEWKIKISEKDRLAKELLQVEGELKSIDAVITTLNKLLTEQHQLYELSLNDYTKLKEQRHQLFGVKNPDLEDCLFEKKVEEAILVKNLVHEEMNQITRNFEANKTKISALSDQISQRKPHCCTIEKDFMSSLHHLGFKDETSYLAHSLSVDERRALTETAKHLDNKKMVLQAKITDRKERLLNESNKEITTLTLSELKPKLEESNQKLKETQMRMSILAIELKNHYENKEKFKNKNAIIEKQKIQCARIEKLHTLIGSSDGKKYRNFAQGLTFELMVNHANQQLEKMSNRYLLIRDEAQPLELNVIDHYQAGEMRTTKNLSGGESFIVSLALALGLSKMASQKVRVDSLFLDEGFGTLDDEALETALDTLSELQQDGKIIGIISHVPALKERISMQIKVQPLGGGRSIIKGLS